MIFCFTVSSSWPCLHIFCTVLSISFRCRPDNLIFPSFLLIWNVLTWKLWFWKVEMVVICVWFCFVENVFRPRYSRITVESIFDRNRCGICSCNSSSFRFHVFLVCTLVSWEIFSCIFNNICGWCRPDCSCLNS